MLPRLRCCCSGFVCLFLSLLILVVAVTVVCYIICHRKFLICHQHLEHVTENPHQNTLPGNLFIFANFLKSENLGRIKTQGGLLKPRAPCSVKRGLPKRCSRARAHQGPRRGSVRRCVLGRLQILRRGGPDCCGSLIEFRVVRRVSCETP